MNQRSSTHPTKEELESFFHGTLEETRRQLVEDHISKCDQCCDELRTIPHDGLIERIHAATSSIDDGQTPWATASTIAESEPADSIPAALLDHPRYRIIRRLGQGGMGVVYQAEHRLMERPVALKVINPRLVSNELAVDRFHQEVKAAAKLSHRNIVAAYDAEQAGDLHFLVMEFIDGISLDQLVARRKPLPVLHACNYVLQAAQGLQHAHARGTVHRDIKPHNLMRTDRGTVKILDFGLARFATQTDHAADDPGLTADFTALGTPDYLAPEQARDSKRADIRADLYSLGCTLYFLLAGHAPFPNESAFEKVLAHCERQPTSLGELRDDVPSEVIAIVEQLMAKNPDDRFQTPAELIEALKPFGRPDSVAANDQPTSDSGKTLVAMPMPQLHVSTESTATRTRTKVSNQATSTWVRRNRWPLFAVSGVLGVALGWYVLADRGEQPPALPEDNSFVGRPSETIPPSTSDAEWIDLIARVDLSSDVVAGNWTVTPTGELRVDHTPSARVMLPFTPPREYDFEVEFTRVEGDQSIALHFVDGDGIASFDIDGWSENLGGIQNIDQIDIRRNPTRIDNIQLINGRRYQAAVHVRRDHVDAFFDGEKRTTYHGDGSDLSLLPLWSLPENTLGLGAYDSDTVFHSVRIRPISN
ncbi:serine/threonine-protein kinase [Bremerella sp. JC817]|uniref:serine/threonine protein kinase n=1 Tax=Bremerella sp. JC817 TaxID=3231756 RepID=UPI00345A2FA3